MYRALVMLVPETVADEAASLLVERGADGVEVEDRTVLPMPGREPLPDGAARLTGYFSPENIDPWLREALAQLAGAPVEVRDEPVPERDWNEVWKSHFAPVHMSPRLWVTPSWRRREVQWDGPVLVLDPGMAFGTGTHATTGLCLEALDEALARRPGASVLDVGTGSGILAIAAKMLGAGVVAGVDNDPAAVRVARENAELNRVEADLSDAPLDEASGRFTLVVANIMANTLLDMVQPLLAHAAAGGELFLSGILDFQADDVAKAYAAAGARQRVRLTRDEWVLLHLEVP